jgi:prefoldin subunit 5
MKEYKIEDMTKKIQALKQTATELKRISGGIQAVDRNVDRILASIKMLEINISDLSGIL